MELTSAHLHKGRIPWRGLLLTASLLTSWSPPATAQVTIEAVPPNVAEGKDVLLLVHNLPQAILVFYWYKGTTEDSINEIGRYITSINMSKLGPAHSGRETIYSNVSLLFQRVTKNDEGVYTLDILHENFNHIKKSVQFSVHPSLLTFWSLPATAQVTIEAVPPNVAEGKDVLLLVHNLPRTLRVFYWYKGTTAGEKSEIARFITSSNKIRLGPAHSGREIIYNNGSLFFQHVTKNDEGVYTLDMLHENFNHIKESVQFSVHPEKHH